MMRGQNRSAHAFSHDYHVTVTSAFIMIHIFMYHKKPWINADTIVHVILFLWVFFTFYLLVFIIFKCFNTIMTNMQMDLHYIFMKLH